MRKESSNQFTEGLVCDLNPINTPNTVLTDALNATIITYDGNEHSLQNDRGNYQLKNCRLKPNYIPVGLKEYGDILYVVSYNPLDNHVEIGSYPSPLNVESSEDSPLEFEIDSVIGSFTESIDYSELIKRCKLLIYTGGDEERYKIYPGDEYNVDEGKGSEYKYETLEYFVIDENRKRYNVSDIIEPDGQWHNVPWQVPGWLAAQYRIGNFEDFDMSIRSLIVPAIVDTKSFGCKANLHFQFKVSDTLFLPIQIGTEEQKLKSENEIKSDLFIKLTIKNSNTVINEEIIPLIEDGKFVEWYMDSKILWTKRELDINNLQKNDNIIIEAVPYLEIKTNGETKIINYDNLREIYSFTLNTIGTSADFHIAEGLWKFYTEPNGDQLYLEFDVSGPNVTSELVNLYYRIHNIDNNSISDWKEVPGYTGISDQIGTSIEFDSVLKPESIYVIEFGFASDIDSVKNIKHITKKVIITSAVFGDLIGSYSDFNDIYFKEWAIDGYGKSLKVNNVKSKAEFTSERKSVTCDHSWNSDGYLTKNGTMVFSDEVLKKLWSNKPFADKGWVPSSSSSAYKNSGINVGFSKEFKTTINASITDYTMLNGDLWDELPGITLNLKDPFDKIIATRETSRKNLSDSITMSAMSSRGKSKYYGTLLNNESFRNIAGIDQIEEIPVMLMTVESVNNGANNQLDVKLYDDGSFKRQSDGTFDGGKSHSQKSSCLVSSGKYDLSSSIPRTIRSLLKECQFGILGIIAKQVETTEGRYQLLHDNEEILLSKKGWKLNRFYTYLVFRKNQSINWPILIPIELSEDGLWNVDIKYPGKLSTYSWNTTARSDGTIMRESLKIWLNKFVRDIQICSSSSALNYYNLLSINSENETVKDADVYKLDVNINGVYKWPIFNNKYDLLNSISRGELVNAIGADICGNLFTSDIQSINQVTVNSMEIRTESLSDDNEFSIKINEFDKKISNISNMVKQPDTESSANLIAQIESRSNSRGVYYVGTYNNIVPLIDQLDTEYCSKTTLEYFQLDNPTTLLAILKVKAENDFLYFGRVATSLTIK